MIDKFAAVDAFEYAMATGDLSRAYAVWIAPDRAQMILDAIKENRERLGLSNK